MTKEFFSAFGINDEVQFQPMFRHQQEMGISHEPIEGKVIAVRFTEAKVFYDIYCNYWGKIFDNVSSEKVWVINQLFPSMIADDK